MYKPKEAAVALNEFIHFQVDEYSFHFLQTDRVVVDLAGFPTIIGNIVDPKKTGAVRYLKAKPLFKPDS